MTKKDYIKIAQTLKTEKPITNAEIITITDEEQLSMWGCVVIAFADMLQKDNPRFDRAKFLTACGYE